MSVNLEFHGPAALHESASRLQDQGLIQLPEPRTFLETPQGWIPIQLPERTEASAREKFESKKKSLRQKR